MATIMVALLGMLSGLFGPMASAQPGPPAPAPHRTPEASAGGLDLAAMMLLPADLPWPDFTVSFGKTWDAATVADIQSQDTGRDAGLYLTGLRADGFVREHRLRIELTDPNARSNSIVTIESYVNEFADLPGAEAGFTLMEDETGVPDTQDVALPGTIGDRSEATISSGVSSDTHVSYDAVDVSFRTGNLYGGVIMHVFASTSDAAPSVALEPPTVAGVAALAEKLLARVAAVRAGTAPAPGLSTKILRLTGSGVEGRYDDYDQLARVAVPLTNETDADKEVRLASYGTAVDVYDLENLIDQNAYTVSRLFRFEDAAAASAWMETIPEQSKSLSASFGDVHLLPNSLDVGDASGGFSYRFTSGNFVTTGHRLYTQVGEMVAFIQIDADPGVSLSVLTSLLEQQAACLGSPSKSCAAVDAPTGLVGS